MLQLIKFDIVLPHKRRTVVRVKIKRKKLKKEEFEDTKRVIRRLTDNTMAKRKRTKGQITIYKTYAQNQCSEVREHLKLANLFYGWHRLNTSKE